MCQRPPYVQAGMRLVSGGIYGSGGGQVPNATSLPVRRVSGNNVIVGWASDPSTITAPAALTIPSDMNTWQGVADGRIARRDAAPGRQRLRHPPALRHRH